MKKFYTIGQTAESFEDINQHIMQTPEVRRRAVKCLDLFCGGGGAGMGYHMAGFDVTGVDIAAQPGYPFCFVRADALSYLADHIEDFDFIHASPPCQKWSTVTRFKSRDVTDRPDYIAPLRSLLLRSGKPWVIENVPGAPLRDAVLLCGTMFGLNLVRHRCFETSAPVAPPGGCRHVKQTVDIGRRPDREKHYPMVVGHFSDVAFARECMGITWLGQKDLAQAIPPAYTRYLASVLRGIRHEPGSWYDTSRSKTEN